ncbi:MAG: ferredoxin:CoB-CoM heterodisulfide reductase subunit HdrB [Methanobrevibacter sp.]|uniref:ferredoxin:CoB-CoM heterodisulfide reductase subunit HdrB n=1 Tax=Methanobrevibacter sp. TaxID=66852 RepID=UPI0026DF78C0|nr:ferredoxin:CoB-CoM heterodisulfide reductase subunit HdrB [Methanobrevibacter sp.]MDO5848725.1 ferredoxin:CoB-CoM heterodisulfide reductase subunit HdrB [Methanobrevibacter sp.]
MKKIPDKDILLFKSCLVSVEYPGIESSTKFVFDKLGVDYEVSPHQTCCTGLGHYSDVFDQFTTTTLGARNFKIAQNINRPNLVMMCATCYAINKKVANILNNKDEVRDKVNEVFKESDLAHLVYEKDSTDSSENIFHVVDILYNKKDEISNHLKYDLSDFKIATHHGCHYCKVHYDDTIGGFRNPLILDELVEAAGCKTIGFYDHKRTTCGSGFRQRYSNKELSLKVTEDKLRALKEDDVDILIHLCPNCHVQFDRYQNLIGENIGEDFDMIHLNISQFLAIVMGADFRKVIGTQTHTVPVESKLTDLKEKI